MTVKEKLLQEFECAIESIFGDVQSEEYEDANVEGIDIDNIAKKVKWYLDLK